MRINTDPVFVVGVGRSGTSLVQSMLAGHSRLAFPPETIFLRGLVANGAIVRALKCRRDSDNLPLLDSDKRVRRTGLDSKDLINHAQKEGTITGGSLYRALLFLYAKRLGKPCYGDKDPRCIEYLGLLVRVLHGVQIIHVIRDPRDVLASKKKAGWSRKRGSIFHIFANRVQIRMGRKQGSTLLGHNYHEILYEELINAPEKVLCDLCQRIGFVFEPGMLDFGKSARELVSKSEMSWKKETLGPLLKNNYGKWKQSLSDWEVALTEMVCAAAFEAGGYKKDGRIKQLKVGQRIGLYMAAAGICVLDPIYCLYRRWTVWRARRYI